MRSVDSTKDLAVFRNEWSGPAVLGLLQQHHGRVLVDWPVGVGKSTNIDHVIECAIREDRFDLVVVLAPTRRILNERPWVTAPPSDVRIVNLKPRPFAQCGSLDGLWQTYERNNLGSLGRQELCGACDKRADCFWPDQYGPALAGTQVIFATQAHLERSPIFIMMLTSWCGAVRVLTILDEANFTMKPVQRRIRREQLRHLQTLMRARMLAEPASWAIEWSRYLEVLVHAKSIDLETGNWHTPFLPPDQISILQEMGRDRWGDNYTFIGYELQLLGKSLQSSREIEPDGTLCFAMLSQISGDCLIYSGSVNHSLTWHRVGKTFASPFADVQFFHPDTRWYNIASRLGAKKYFRKNAAQILDFISQLIALRLAAGKRVLLVAKKHFLPLCREGIQDRLTKTGLPETQVVIASDDLDDTMLQDPRCVPIINFGMVGTNRFEHFDCCYCLTGFYVKEQTVHETVQDLYRQDIQVNLEVGLGGTPLRRYARVKDRRHRHTEVNHLAQAALDHLEMSTVIQAVGRVRPYTQPREIITFQCAAHPEDAYDQEFQTIGEARTFFGIADARARCKQHNRARVQQSKCRGLTQRETAEVCGLSLRTVKRHWNPTGGCHEPL
jgi:hypothetical protein